LEEEKDMLSQKFVELIEKNADSIAKEWLKDVTHNAYTPTYHTFDPDRLYERAFSMYKWLGEWLSIQTGKEKTAEYYKKYGKDRFLEGFPLQELIYSFILFRRHLWLFILHAGFLDTAYELLRGMELNNRVILFFDRALYNMVLGYQEASQRKK
jgi:hypothetical protein